MDGEGEELVEKFLGAGGEIVDGGFDEFTIVF